MNIIILLIVAIVIVSFLLGYHLGQTGILSRINKNSDKQNIPLKTDIKYVIAGLLILALLFIGSISYAFIE